jgi:hypothetical protein
MTKLEKAVTLLIDIKGGDYTNKHNIAFGGSEKKRLFCKFMLYSSVNESLFIACSGLSMKALIAKFA